MCLENASELSIFLSVEDFIFKGLILLVDRNPVETELPLILIISGLSLVLTLCISKPFEFLRFSRAFLNFTIARFVVFRLLLIVHKNLQNTDLRKMDFK